MANAVWILFTASTYGWYMMPQSRKNRHIERHPRAETCSTSNEFGLWPVWTTLFRTRAKLGTWFRSPEENTVGSPGPSG